MDFYRDQAHAKLSVIARVKETPEFVKQAAIIDFDTIPDRMFALPEKRAYSIADPASTYLSFGYWMMNRNNMDKREDERCKHALVKAGEFYGISEELLDFAREFQDTKKQMEKASDDRNYGLPESKAYPLHTHDHVAMACDAFPRNISRYDMPERRQIAQRIMQKASEFNMRVMEPSIIKYASGNDLMRSDKTAMNIAARATLLPPDNIDGQMLLNKLAHALIGNVDGPAMMMKLATTLENVDDHFGITPTMLISSGIPDPFSTVFNLTEKQAIDMVGQAPINIAGEAFTIGDLAELPANFWEEVFGTDFVSAVVGENGMVDPGKLAIVIETLPLPEKNILVRYLKQQFASEPKAI